MSYSDVVSQIDTPKIWCNFFLIQSRLSWAQVQVWEGVKECSLMPHQCGRAQAEEGLHLPCTLWYKFVPIEKWQDYGPHACHTAPQALLIVGRKVFSIPEPGKAESMPPEAQSHHKIPWTVQLWTILIADQCLNEPLFGPLHLSKHELELDIVGIF